MGFLSPKTVLVQVITQICLFYAFLHHFHRRTCYSSSFMCMYYNQIHWQLSVIINYSSTDMGFPAWASSSMKCINSLSIHLYTPVQIKWENWFLHKALLNHIIENWNYTIHRYCVIGHTKDSIKFCCNKG